MATILDSYALSSGETNSTAITDANNVRFQFEVSGATNEEQVVEYSFLVNDGTTDVPLVDDNDREIKGTLVANSKKSRNLLAVNTASLKVKIKPRGTCDGTITVTTFQS